MECVEPGLRSAGTGEHDRPAVFDLDWVEGNRCGCALERGPVGGCSSSWSAGQFGTVAPPT